MRGRNACLIVGLAFSTASGCHKKTPEGLPFAYVDAVSALADQTAKYCDRLLHESACYSALSMNPDNEHRPAVPLPDNPLGGIPELRQLKARCDSADEHNNRQLWCDAKSVVKTRLPRECEMFSLFGSWPVINRLETEGVTLSVVDDPACKAPWVEVAAVQKTPGGDWFSLNAYFLPKKWLDEHPEDAKDARK